MIFRADSQKQGFSFHVGCSVNHSKPRWRVQTINLGYFQIPPRNSLCQVITSVLLSADPLVL